jgi:hypothetical protein
MCVDTCIHIYMNVLLLSTTQQSCNFRCSGLLNKEYMNTVHNTWKLVFTNETEFNLGYLPVSATVNVLRNCHLSSRML